MVLRNQQWLSASVTRFNKKRKKATKSSIKSSGNFPYLMNTNSTSIFLYFSFTRKLGLRRKGELYPIARSHNLASWRTGSSQSRREGIGDMVANFLRGSGCPKAVVAKPKCLRLSGYKGASLG